MSSCHRSSLRRYSIFFTQTSKEDDSSSDDENSSEDLINAQKSNLRRNSIQSKLFSPQRPFHAFLAAELAFHRFGGPEVLAAFSRDPKPAKHTEYSQMTTEQPDLEEECRRAHPTHDSEAMAAGASASFMMRNLARNKESLHHKPPDLSTAGLFFSD